MRPKLSLSIALTIAAVTALTAGCGRSEKPSHEAAARADVASELNRDLDIAERRVEPEECEKARESFERLDRGVRSRLGEVDEDARSTLERRLERVAKVVHDKCEAEGGPAPDRVARPPDTKTPGSAPAGTDREPQAEAPRTEKPQTPTATPTGGRRSGAPTTSNTPSPSGGGGSASERDICGENPAPEC